MRIILSASNIAFSILNNAGENVLDYSLGEYNLSAAPEGIVDAFCAAATEIKAAITKIEAASREAERTTHEERVSTHSDAEPAALED